MPKYYTHGTPGTDASDKPKGEASLAASRGYAHPTTLQEFEATYREEYTNELASCDRWIKWCEQQNDTHGMNFHQGKRSALIFNDIKMCQLLRVLKQEPPNASGHNATELKQPKQKYERLQNNRTCGCKHPR